MLLQPQYTIDTILVKLSVKYNFNDKSLILVAFSIQNLETS